MSSDPFGSPDLQVDPATSNSSQAPTDDVLNSDGSLASHHSLSLILQSIVPLALSVIFLLGGRRLYKFSTATSLALSFSFFSWAIIVNVEPPGGLGATTTNPEVHALCVWSIMIACGLVGAVIGYQRAWWGSSGAGLLALGANAGLSFCFGLILLGDDLLIHSQPAIWLLAILVIILSAIAVVRTEYVASLVACSVVGGFLLLLAVDLLINLGHQGVGRGICFLVDHNPDHREALTHYTPPKSTRVMIIVSWMMTLCSVIFQSSLYKPSPFLPPEDRDSSHPFKQQRDKEHLQDIELALPPRSTDELRRSEKEREITTATTTTPGLEKWLPQSSTSSLNRLGFNYVPCIEPHPLNVQSTLNVIHPLSAGNNNDLISADNFPNRQCTSQINSLARHPPDCCTPDKSSVHPPQVNQVFRSLLTSPPAAEVQNSPRTLISPAAIGTQPALVLSPEAYSNRYKRTPDPAHELLQSPSRIPSASGSSHPRRPPFRSQAASASFISRDFPSSISHSQKLRRVDTVEEVTEASTSIRDIEGFASARSSLVTPIDMVRSPSVSAEYVQAMLRLASETDSDVPPPLSTAPNQNLTANAVSTEGVREQIPLSPVAEGRDKEKTAHQAEPLDSETQPDVAVPVEGFCEAKRNSWLGVWAHSTDSLESTRFELSMPQNVYPGESKAQAGHTAPAPERGGSSDTAKAGDMVRLTDNGAVVPDERSSSVATQRTGFDLKKLKKSSSSSLKRGLRLLTGGEREKPKTEDDSSDYQPSSPSSSCHPNLVPPVIRRPGHASSPQRHNPLLPGSGQRQPRLGLSTSTSSDLLCRTSRRLGPVGELAARSSRPRGTSILSLSSEELKLGGLVEEDEAEARYLQRFSQRPLARVPANTSSEDHSGSSTTHGGGSEVDPNQRIMKNYNSIESTLRGDIGMLGKFKFPEVSNGGPVIESDNGKVSRKGNPFMRASEQVGTDCEDENSRNPLVPLTPMANRTLGSTFFGKPDSRNFKRFEHLKSHSSVDTSDYRDDEDEDYDRMTVRTPRSERSTVYGRSGLASSRSHIDQREEDDDDARSVVYHHRKPVRWENGYSLEANQDSVSSGSGGEADDVSGPDHGSPSLQSIPLPSSPGGPEAYELAEKMSEVNFYPHRSGEWVGESRRRLQRMVPSLASFGGGAARGDERTTILSSGEEDVWKSARATSKPMSESGRGSIMYEGDGITARGSFISSRRLDEGSLVPSIEESVQRDSIMNSSDEPDSRRRREHVDGKEGSRQGGRVRQRKDNGVAFKRSTSQSGYEEEDEDFDDDLVTVEHSEPSASHLPHPQNFITPKSPVNSKMRRTKTSTTDSSYTTAQDGNSSRRQSRASRK